jgi:hypothetical protein
MRTALNDEGLLVFSNEIKKTKTKIKKFYNCCGFKDNGSICDDKVFLRRCDADRYKVQSYFCHCKGSACSESTKYKKQMDDIFFLKWSDLIRTGVLKNKYWITDGTECISNDKYNIFILKKLPSLDFFLDINIKKRTVYILDVSTLYNFNIVKCSNEYFIKQDLMIFKKKCKDAYKKPIDEINPEVLDYKNIDVYIDKLDNLLYKVCLNTVYYDKNNTSYFKISIVSLSREITRFGDIFNINNYDFENIIEDTTEYTINDEITNKITPETKTLFDDTVINVNELKKCFITLNKKYKALIITDYTKEELDVVISDYTKVDIPLFKNIFLKKFLKSYINEKIKDITLRINELYYDNLNKNNILMMEKLETIVSITSKNLPSFDIYIELILYITFTIKNIIDNNIILYEANYLGCNSLKEVKKKNAKYISKNIKECLFHYTSPIENVLKKIDKISNIFDKKELIRLHNLKNIEDTFKQYNKLQNISNIKEFYLSYKIIKLIMLFKNISSHYNPLYPHLKINNKEVIDYYKEYFSNKKDNNITTPIKSYDIFFESEWKNRSVLLELGCKWNDDEYKYSYNTSLDETNILQIKLLSYNRIYFESAYKYKDAIKKLGGFYDFKKNLSYYPNTFDEKTIKRIKQYETIYI